MKSFRSTPVKHLAAMLLAFVMLASVCSFPVFADYESDYAEYQQVRQELDNIWSLSYDEQPAAYAALGQKYPKRPDVAYEVVSRAHYDSPNDALAAYDQVIKLAQNYSGSYLCNADSEWEIIQNCYKNKASIYLTKLYQQENYISSMRSALDAEEQANRMWFGAGINATSAVEGLQNVQAKRAELDEIERWYKSGSPANFTAWNGRVQVTVDAGNRTAHVQMQTPNGERTLWKDLPSGESVEAGTITYSSVSQDISCGETYAQPISKVLRAIENVYFVMPVRWNQFYQAVDALEPDDTWNAKHDALYSSIYSARTTYYKTDGTTQTQSGRWSLSTEPIGLVRDFFDMRDLSLPADILRFMKTECSEEWNAGGSADYCIHYSAELVQPTID